MAAVLALRRRSRAPGGLGPAVYDPSGHNFLRQIQRRRRIVFPTNGPEHHRNCDVPAEARTGSRRPHKRGPHPETNLSTLPTNTEYFSTEPVTSEAHEPTFSTQRSGKFYLSAMFCPKQHALQIPNKNLHTTNVFLTVGKKAS